MPGRAMRGSTDFDSYRSKPCPPCCLSDVGAALHLPAGILSPYRDGERGAVIDGFATLIAPSTNASASTI
ncbi:MAG: hypothetical protein EOS78_31690 [Mesorhizobium sp.]|nr:MAG: hypothetical protein EOS78_31690 [Mesorhizobium sp.]